MAEEGFNIDKTENFSEWFTEVVKQAELADQRYEIKGLIIHRPNAAITEDVMFEVYKKSLEKRGHKPCKFPSIIPESYFSKESEHVEGFAPGVFWITKGGTDPEFDERLALRPTSETAMYTAYSDWIRSHRDLPLKIYQACQVWRYETKHTRPFIRDREFHWIEAHNVFATAEEAKAQTIEDMEITQEMLHDSFGIPFFFFKRPEWDKFAGSVYSFAADALMPDGKVLQLPSTHYYGQNFSKPFNIKFTNEKEEEEYGYQTTYGPAISRIYAALISTHGDSKGLVLPFKLAPTQVVIIPIIFKEKKKKSKEKCAKCTRCLKTSTAWKLMTRTRILEASTTTGNSEGRLSG